MSKNQITIVLNGVVTLDDYSKAMSGFTSLIKNLHSQHAKKIDIEWQVEQLESGSAIATIRGNVENKDQEIFVERIVNDYEHIGEISEKGNYDDIPEYAKMPMQSITSVINGKIPTIRFETQDKDFSVTVNYKTHIKNEKYLHIPTLYFDTVIGRVQNLFQQPTYRFTLYENITQKPVSCYLNADYEEIMRDAWGKYACVEGMVKINPIDGLPESIRDIKNVMVYKDTGNDTWESAVGAANGILGEYTPEDFVRSLRDD